MEKEDVFNKILDVTILMEDVFHAELLSRMNQLLKAALLMDVLNIS